MTAHTPHSPATEPRRLGRLRHILRKPWFLAAVAFPLTVLALLLFACTLVPAAYQGLFASQAVPVKSSLGSVIDVRKAQLATACTKDGTQCIEDVVLIYGKLDEGTLTAVQQLLKSTPVPSNTFCFYSPGGNVSAATKLGNWIVDNDANTCLAERYFIKGQGTLRNTICHSACPLVLLTGKERTVLGDELKMRVHSPGIRLDFCFACWKASLSDFFASYLWRDLLTLRSRPEDKAHLQFLERALKTNFAETELLEPQEWQNYSIFTHSLRSA